MDKTEYIMALLRHCQRIKLSLSQDSHNILFFMFHVKIPLSTAKEHLEAYADHIHNREGN